MGFEIFGFGKKKTNEAEPAAQEISPERMAEMLAHEEEYLKNNPGPAEFKGSEDLDMDPNTMSNGLNRDDIWAVGEAKHVPKIDNERRI